MSWYLVFAKAIQSMELGPETLCCLQPENAETGFGDVADFFGAGADGEEIGGAPRGLFCTLEELVSGSIRSRIIREISGPNRERLLKTWCQLPKINPVYFWKQLKVIQDRAVRERHTLVKRIALAELIDWKSAEHERQLKYRVALAAARGVSINEISPELVQHHLRKISRYRDSG